MSVQQTESHLQRACVQHSQPANTVALPEFAAARRPADQQSVDI